MFPARLTAFLAACAGMLLAAPPVLAATAGDSESTPLNLPPADQAGAAAGGGGGGGLVRTGRGLVLPGVAEQAVVPIRSGSEDGARALGLLDRDPNFESDPPTAPPS